MKNKTETNHDLQVGLMQRLFGTASASGKNRGYKKRPTLYDADGNYESYRQRRLRLIAESQRQGVEIAKASRAAYVQRRTSKWCRVLRRLGWRRLAEGCSDFTRDFTCG